MARVTTSEVKLILKSDTGISDASLTQFIDTANEYLNSFSLISGYSSDRLKQIELYLSAHFATCSEPIHKRRKTGNAEEEYQVPTGEGLSSSTYGQTALLLDTNGYLISDSSKRVTLLVF